MPSWRRFYAQTLGVLTVGLAMGCVAGSDMSAAMPTPSSNTGPILGSGAGDPLAGTIDPTDPNASDIPFTPDIPSTYVTKIKTRLTGLPATDAETTAGSSESGLAALVDGWIASDTGKSMMQDFFSAAFQQKYIGIGITQYLNSGVPSPQNQSMLEESFPRTALDWVEHDKPFNELFTTKTYMVNTWVLSYMLRADVVNIDDRGRMRDLFASTIPSYHVTIRNAPIGDLNSIFDPNSPNFLSFYLPSRSDFPVCKNTNDILVYAKDSRNLLSNDLGSLLGGGGFSYNAPPLNAQNEYCKPGGGVSLYTAADLQDWRLVTFEQSADSNKMTQFFDFPTLRKATQVQVRSEKVGYLTSVPFMAQWMSNSGNDARGITNQALVVALNRTFDGSDLTAPASTLALDSVHSDPTTTCYACHRAMDPMRQYFRQTYSNSFHLQDDPNQKAILGTWVMDGASSTGPNLTDFATRLSQHPGVALAWSKKLCDYLNSTNCMETDPELIRIAKVFSDSNYNFKTLLKAMLVSPLTTNAVSTLTARRLGVTVSLSRQKLLCKSLSARLGLVDACAVAVATAAALPDDTYSRGSVNPVYIASPTLITRSATENLCGMVATTAVDAGATAKYSSTNVPVALSAMVSDLMGVPGPDQPPYVDILQQHYTRALASGASATVALRSAFVIACLSPQVAANGI